MAVRFGRLETQRRREAVTGARYNTARRRLLYQLLDIAKAGEVDGAAPAPAAAPTAREKVFISYNHADADTAQSIKRVLQERGIDVHIDAAEMQPGEDIRAFITRSIRATSCTFCLISQRSLLSGWVGLESMLALTARELWSDRLFVAGYLDTDFFDLGFRLDATRRIDERIAEIDQLMLEYLARQLDTIDLNAERTRALDLRAQPRPDSRGAARQPLPRSAPGRARRQHRPVQRRLVAARNARRGSRARPVMIESNNVLRRSDHIRELIANNELTEAVKKLMDFVRDFSENRRDLDQVTFISADLRELKSAARRERITFAAERKFRNSIIFKSLELMNTVVDAACMEIAHA